MSPTIPSSLTAGMEQLVQPAAILVVHPSPTLVPADSKVLVHWRDLPAYEDSWGSSTVIRNQFPHFNLEEKVNAWAAGNDKPKIKITYMRRKKGKYSPDAI